MSGQLTQEIQLRLKAPMAFLEKTIQGRRLPQIFAEAAFEELKRIQRLVKKLEREVRI